MCIRDSYKRAEYLKLVKPQRILLVAYLRTVMFIINRQRVTLAAQLPVIFVEYLRQLSYIKRQR